MNENPDINLRIADTIREFVTAQHANIPVAEFLFHLLLAAALGAGMGFLYARYGTSFSNRRQFARNFILLCMATMLIISIVKSSLALSLGLVGALSIVRFRAAIKDPEELVFLFLTIALGLGLGAGQLRVTLLGFAGVAIVIVARGLLGASTQAEDVLVSISSSKNGGLDAKSALETLEKHCSSVGFKRMEEYEGLTEMAFVVTVSSFEDLAAARDALARAKGVSRLVFLDRKGAAY